MTYQHVRDCDDPCESAVRWRTHFFPSRSKRSGVGDKAIRHFASCLGYIAIDNMHMRARDQMAVDRAFPLGPALAPTTLLLVITYLQCTVDPCPRQAAPRGVSSSLNAKRERLCVYCSPPQTSGVLLSTFSAPAHTHTDGRARPQQNSHVARRKSVRGLLFVF